MDVKILDRDFVAVGIVENFQSFIWTDRYCSYGDFEIYTPLGSAFLNDIQIGYYLWNAESEHMMIVEAINVTTDVENGTFIKITGRSLESILARRIVWAQTTISGNIQNGVKRLINEAIINPSIAIRKIDNFVFEDSTDPNITGYTFEAQYTGDNLYDVIVDICNDIGCGFKVVLNENKEFVFSMYHGVDRSGDVIFSNEYNNLITTDYLNDFTEFKNVTLVAGEGEGTDRKTVVVGTAEGLDRYELYTDARDLSTNNGQIPLATYQSQLTQRGNEKLSEAIHTEQFNGTVEPNVMFTYGLDYVCGDIVTFVDTFGNKGTPRIDEYIFSYDEQNGYYCYPTFVILEE